MIPVVNGEQPVIFDVDTEEQIRGVLALADTFDLKVILRGASEAWQVAEELARRQVPVIVGPLTRAPAADAPYDAIFANPGVLARAGVKIAFQTDNASDVRNLPYNAALATAFGLDPEMALRALTINPAEIWGVADRYGSLEPGKVANVIVTIPEATTLQVYRCRQWVPHGADAMRPRDHVHASAESTNASRSLTDMIWLLKVATAK